MEFIELIGQVGFPIAVATWLLIKFEAKLDAAEAAARDLAAKIAAHTERCVRCREGKACRDCPENRGETCTQKIY